MLPKDYLCEVNKNSVRQTLITHTQGLFVCYIQEFCWAVLEKKIFKGLHLICYIQIVFGYYFATNIGGTTIWTNLFTIKLKTNAKTISFMLYYLYVQIFTSD